MPVDVSSKSSGDKGQILRHHRQAGWGIYELLTTNYYSEAFIRNHTTPRLLQFLPRIFTCISALGNSRP